MQKRRKKIPIQVNKLKFEISLLQFEKLAEILKLNELKIYPKPNFTLNAYNLGTEKKQNKIDKILYNNIKENQKTKFNIYWAIYPKQGRKDYITSLATFSQIENIPDPAIFYGLISHLYKKQNYIPSINEFLKEGKWNTINKNIIDNIEQNKEIYQAITEAKLKKFFEANI
ncbi:MAG: hypothetical protein LBC64_07570 [Fibromonadaceae bacterium]|nr:hypothetical protein [Fibromonadaceae bacterium]